MTPEQRLAAAGIELPTPYAPAGLYAGAVHWDGLLHIGGHGPVRSDGSMITGKVVEHVVGSGGGNGGRPLGDSPSPAGSIEAVMALHPA